MCRYGVIKADDGLFYHWFVCYHEDADKICFHGLKGGCIETIRIFTTKERKETESAGKMVARYEQGHDDMTVKPTKKNARKLHKKIVDTYNKPRLIDGI